MYFYLGSIIVRFFVSVFLHLAFFMSSLFAHFCKNYAKICPHNYSFFICGILVLVASVSGSEKWSSVLFPVTIHALAIAFLLQNYLN